MDTGDIQKILAIATAALALLATFAKLYHNRIVAAKDAELHAKDRDLTMREQEAAGLRGELAAAREALVLRGADAATGDLGKLSAQLTEWLDASAKTLGAQGASLYLPFGSGDEAGDFPRGFAFVAVYNTDPSAARKARAIMLVENWTIVGQCWLHKQVTVDNALQKNQRHVASYDKQTGFVPAHALLSPVFSQQRPVGVIQFFNKGAADGGGAIAPSGFESADRLELQKQLASAGGEAMAERLQQFFAHPDWPAFLGLRDESTLENAAIMHLDLTNSSSMYDETPLIEAVTLMNRFNTYVHRTLAPFSAAIDRFSGDGTMVIFYFREFDAGDAANAAFRSVCAASALITGFSEFKMRQWRRLPQAAAAQIRLRITISLGPVASYNAGPRESQAPTATGPTVSRSAKMVAYAPRARDVVLIDDNVYKAIALQSPTHESAMRPFQDWKVPTEDVRTLAGFSFFEVDSAAFASAAASIRARPWT